MYSIFKIPYSKYIYKYEKNDISPSHIDIHCQWLIHSRKFTLDVWILWLFILETFYIYCSKMNSYIFCKSSKFSHFCYKKIEDVFMILIFYSIMCMSFLRQCILYFIQILWFSFLLLYIYYMCFICMRLQILYFFQHGFL